MKKLSSRLLLLLSVVFVLFSAGTSRANRAGAGDISYKWISDSTYLLTYTLYRDCGGATAEPTSVQVCYYNTCNTDKGNVSLSKKTPLGSNGLPVTMGCSGMPNTTCSATPGTTRGFRKWVYEGAVTLPSKCASWHFVVSLSSRNGLITNYAVPATSNNMFSEATLNNIDAPRSSSPSFGVESIQYMCAGVKQNFNYGGVDADGDVLSYSLIDPATAADNQVTCTIPPTPTSYAFGSSNPGTSLANNPFQTGSTFNLDGSTGAMSFTPLAAPPQLALMTMLITKRRGTTVVGTVTRDIEFVISNTCTPTNVSFLVNKPLSSPSINWSFPAPNDDTAILCPNLTYKICFDITAADPTATITNVTDNAGTFSTTPATMGAYSGIGTNRVSNCMDWSPVEQDERTKYVIIKSEICKPGAPKIYRIDSIKIEVIETAAIVATDTMICLFDNTLLCAKPHGPSFSWCPTISGSGTCLPGIGIATPLDSCTIVTPGNTTTYLLELGGIRQYCKRKDLPALFTNQAEQKIVVVRPRISAGPDTIMCSYSTLQLNSNNLFPQPELTYKYVWTPGKWLDDSTSATPKLSFPPGTPVSDIPDQITFYLDVITFPQLVPGCNARDTLVVDILKGFYILTGDTLAGNTGLGHLGRQKGVSDTAICAGQFVRLEGWGDPRYNYIWTPTTGVSTPTNWLPGTTTITPTATTTYALTAARAGCRDSVKFVNIVVEPFPTADIGPDRAICFGDTVNLYAAITPDIDLFPTYKYSWVPGGSLSRADTFFTYFTGYKSEKIKFTVTTPAGCSGSDEVEITVQPRSFLTAGADTSICPGDVAQLSVVGDPLLVSVSWKPQGDMDSVNSLTPKVTPAFTTNYVVIGVDSNQCVDSADIKVTVFPRAIIYLEDSVTIFPGQTYQLKPEGNTLYHTWFPPIGLDFPTVARPNAKPLLNTTYTVVGRTEKGCIATDSIYIFVAPDSYIDIPNAFVPGRGDNNVFKPLHLGDATLKSFTVYNRWGTKVFESTDFTKGWDGSYGGQPQPFGVYVYVLEAVSANGVPITKQGNVTLVR